jgi:Restriction endonuclease/FHA domain
MAEVYLESTERAEGLLQFRGETVQAGSSAGCDIVINDPTVSRRHAIFRRVESSWIVEDTGSTNGTWVNGRRITGPTTITAGDHISLGRARFFFQDGKTPIELERGSETIDSAGHLRYRIIALRPYDFEKLIGELFRQLEFEVIVTKQSSDGGVDVEAVNNGVIFRGKYLIQCKRYSPKNRVSRPEIQGFFGRIASEPGAKGIFVTSSSFTRGAREFAQSTGINLIDGEELERLVLRYHLL